jgi:hypothetical protein
VHPAGEIPWLAASFAKECDMQLCGPANDIRQQCRCKLALSPSLESACDQS